jgi:hypothetical protein
MPVSKEEVVDGDYVMRLAKTISKDWVDPCGIEFELKYKPVQAGKCIKIRIMGITEISLKHLLAQLHKKFTNVCIDSIYIDFENSSVDLVFGRMCSKSETKITGTKRKATDSQAPSTWIQKLMTRVDSDDTETIRAILEKVQTWDDGSFGSDFKARIKTNPSSYQICISGFRDVSLSQMPDNAQGVVHFETKTLTLTAKKDKPIV